MTTMRDKLQALVDELKVDLDLDECTLSKSEIVAYVHKLESILATPEPAVTGAAWCPNECPITLLPFFMWIEHPTAGMVPTYGGPFDSYTIPQTFAEDRKGQKRHEISYYRERYDHDMGGWVDGVEVVEEVVIFEDDLNGLIAAAESSVEPPAVTVRAGWYAKDFNGISWYQEEPVFDGRGHWCRRDFDSHYIEDVDGIIIDPWPDHTNGGPECIMEVR